MFLSPSVICTAQVPQIPAPPQLPVILALKGYTSTLFACNIFLRFTVFSLVVITFPSTLISSMDKDDRCVVTCLAIEVVRKNASTETTAKTNTTKIKVNELVMITLLEENGVVICLWFASLLVQC